MKRTMRQFFLGLGLLGAFFVVQTSVALAGDNVLCPPNAPRSEVCAQQGDPIAGEEGLIYDAVQLISIVAGIVAVVMIMYSGFSYITAGGDNNKIQEAKKTLTWSIIGLIVIVLARSIILFVISKL